MLSTFAYCKPQLYYYFCECNQWSMELRSSGQTRRKGIAIGKPPKRKILPVLLFLLFITTSVYAWLKLHQTADVNWAVIYIWTVWRTNQLAVNFDYGVIYLSQFLCYIIHRRYSGFNSGMYCMKTLWHSEGIAYCKIELQSMIFVKLIDLHCKAAQRLQIFF